jgi:hypothetical protein
MALSVAAGNRRVLKMMRNGQRVAQQPVDALPHL